VAVADPAVTVATPIRTRGPIAEVLGLPGYRRFWISQLLVSIVSGTMRFAFVWLVLDLSDWKPAVGIMGFCVGLPMTFLSLPAGVLSDRHDRRRLVSTCSLAGAVLLAATGGLVGAGVVGVPGVAVLALGVGSTLALVSPALQAMVPSLVPPDRLVTGIALQGIGQNVAQMSGVLVGGAAIQLLGTAKSFFVLAVLLAGAALIMLGVPEVASGMGADRRAEAGPLPKMLPAIKDGLHYVLSGQPLRTVIAIAFVGGTCGAMVQLVLPGVARDEFGSGPFAAALLFGGLGFGMIFTTLVLAARRGVVHPGLVLGLAFVTTCGPGMVIMGVAPTYGVAMLGMLWWGLGGGFVLTTQRTLLQRHTPDHMMGRALSVHTLALNGTFPLAALAAALLVGPLGAQGTLIAWGLMAFLLAVFLAGRKGLRDA
jgi:MFS family permease